MSRNFKKIAVASALVAATTLPTTMVSALETNVKNDSNTPVTLSSERRGWYEEYGYKYYYDDNGELLKGLQEIDGNTYYFYSYDGHMAYSSWSDYDTINDSGMIVKVNRDGYVKGHAKIEANKWIQIDKDWYYFDDNLYPYQGVRTVDGVKYYFEYNGRLATTTYKGIKTTTYNCQLIAYDQDGVVTEQTDIVGNKWIKFNNDWYYFDKNLNPYTGVHTIDGVRYYFLWDGKLPSYDSVMVNTTKENNYLISYNGKGLVVEYVKIEGNKWIKFNDNWYYYDKDLNPYQGVYTIDGVKYYFDYNGRLATSTYDRNTTYVSGNVLYAYNKDGIVVAEMNIVGNQWIDFNDEWYYFDSNLNPYNGVHKIGDKTYFFWSNGRLATTDTEGFLSSIKSDNKLVVYNNKGEVVECVDIVGNKWIEFNQNKYYFDSNLNPYQGIQTIDGVEYFFTYEGQLAEYMDEAVASKDILVYVKDGKVIAKTKIEDEKLTYLNGKYYYYYPSDYGDYYYAYYGVHEIDGKKLFFKNGELQTSDSDEILTESTGDYIYAYNNKGEVVATVKKDAGWIQVADEWYYFDENLDEPYEIQRINGVDYYFESGKLIKSKEGISVTTAWDKDTSYIIAYNDQGIIVEKVKTSENQWVKFRNKWYYFDEYGDPADGITTIKGVKYVFVDGELLTASGNNIEVTTAYEKGKMLLVAYDKNGIVKETTVITSRKLTEFRGNKYLYDRHYEPCTGWQEVDGTKYHFDADGKITTGWLEEEKTWYYLDKDGQKTTGWLTLSGKKYYFDKEGKMVTGTVNIDGKDYTFNESGELTVETPEVKSGWVQSGKKWYYYDNNQKVTGYYTEENTKYYFDANGVMQTGWFKIDGEDYYAASSGAITAQWVGSGNNWYYVDADGKMVTGFQTISGVKYYFETNGLMKKGWFKVNGTDYYASTSGEIKAQWVGSGNNWYYVDADGKMVTGFQTIAGAKYYFASSGLMQTGWFKINGTDYYATSSGAIKAQWVGSGNIWYYVDADGKMVTGYQTIAGAKYYFANSGLMQTGWFKINKEDYYAPSSGSIQEQWVKSGSNWYYVDANGKMVTGDYKINEVVNRFDANGVWLGKI